MEVDAERSKLGDEAEGISFPHARGRPGEHEGGFDAPGPVEHWYRQRVQTGNTLLLRDGVSLRGHLG